MLRGLLYVSYSVSNRVADPHNFNAGPDPPFHFNVEMRIRIRIFSLMRIRIQNPAFHSKVETDLDPAYQNNADPDLQLCLQLYLKLKIN
jgi:hypothetical protein